MARLKSIVDECLLIANAFNEINSQTYNEFGAVNFEDNDKNYPFFLFNKRSVSVVVDKYSRVNLPSSTTYECNIVFMNTYTELEKETIDLQTKQDELINISYKYFAELRSRNDSGDNGFYLLDIRFNSIDETHNERLIQLDYTVTFSVKLEDCSLGTFNY